MPDLHPQIQHVLKVMAEANLRPIEAMTPAEAREQMEATASSRKAEPLPVDRVEERSIPGPAGDIRLRLYWPRTAAPVPAIVYYHGGGHVIGSLDTHDLIARNLCAGAEAVVAAVDYRMGPEHKFPAAVDDSFAALKWIHTHAVEIGADTNRLGVHGDSAGANLAAVVALYAVALFDPPYWAWQVVLLAGLAVSCVLMVVLGPWIEAYFGRKDPQPVVLDEVAGLFTEDALFVTGATELRGRAAIKNRYIERTVVRTTRHLYSGLRVTGTGGADPGPRPARVRARSTWVNYAVNAPAPADDAGVYLVADFDDVLTWCADDRWRISERRIIPVLRDPARAPVTA